MWHPVLFFSLLTTVVVSSVHATALTYKLAANEKACFFADVKSGQVNSKIAFYFAVRSLPHVLITLPRVHSPPPAPVIPGQVPSR